MCLSPLVLEKPNTTRSFKKISHIVDVTTSPGKLKSSSKFLVTGIFLSQRYITIISHTAYTFCQITKKQKTPATRLL